MSFVLQHRKINKIILSDSRTIRGYKTLGFLNPNLAPAGNRKSLCPDCKVAKKRVALRDCKACIAVHTALWRKNNPKKLAAQRAKREVIRKKKEAFLKKYYKGRI